MAELVRRQPWASGVEGGGDKATNDKDAKEHRNEQDAVVDGDDPNAKARRERHSVFEDALSVVGSFSALAVEDAVFRGLFLGIPDTLMNRYPNLDRAVSYICLYCGLQVLGMLYGFLVNAFASISLLVGSFIMGRMEVQSVVQLLATTYIVYATIRVLVHFGGFTWTMSIESLHEFPRQRRMILLDRNSRLVMLGLLLAILGLTIAIQAVPRYCAKDDDSAICSAFYFKYLQKGARTARGLWLTLILVICQWLQMLLYELPSLQAAVAWRPGRLVLGGAGAYLMAGSALYVINRIADAAGFEDASGSQTYFARFSVFTGGVRICPDVHAFGTLMLLGWELWFLVLVMAAQWHEKPHTYSQDGILVRVMKRMKWTLVIVSGLQFVHSTLHTKRGFAVASEELLYTSLLAPVIYISLYSISLMVMRSSWSQLAFVVPTASMLAYLACAASGVQGPVTYLLVLLSFWEQCVRAYGLRGLLSSVLVPSEDDTLSVDSIDSFMRHESLVDDLPESASTDALGSPASRVDSSSLRAVRRHSVQAYHTMSQAAIQVAMVVMKGFIGLIVIFIAVMIGLNLLSFFQDEHAGVPSSIKLEKLDDRIHINHVSVIDLNLYTTPRPAPGAEDRVPQYAVCGHEWHGLTIIDYALLAEAAYFDPKDHDVQAVVDTFFPVDKGVTFKVIHPGANLSRYGHAEFFEAYSEQLDLSVIAIRGTDVGRAQDFIEDVKMFAETIIYQILSWVFPSIRMWPDRLFAFMVEVYAESLSLVGLQNTRWYFNILVEYVDQFREQHPKRNVMITGHSLGGALARISGFLTERASVTFSSPGIVHTHRKIRLQYETEAGEKKHKRLDSRNLHHKTINIWPESDPFAAVDKQSGMLQRIHCLDESKALFLSCHMLEGTLCELLQRCGDTRGRFYGCDYSYQLSNLILDMWPYLRPIVTPVAFFVFFVAVLSFIGDA